jgi:excisionase family DNA binding protein
MVKGKNEVLTTKEACDYLRISRPTCLKLIHTNQIKARKVGKGWKVLRSELRAYLGQVDVSEMGRSERKEKRKEPALREREVVDAIDQNILRILSLYERLTPLQLWYELGEDRVVRGSISEEETRKRLESLVARGYVEKVRKAGFDDGSVLPAYRLKRCDSVAGSEEEALREVGL